ncbi:MAG: VanZ family protein [Lentimicrobium sp.]|nr:VanZ family protein [Lentimicrobium sp.]
MIIPNRMLLFIKNFWQGFAWWCFILALTFSPGGFFPKVNSFWSLFSPDKIIHLLIFGVLIYLLLRGSVQQYKTKKSRYIIAIPIVITGFTAIATEVFQAVFPIGRDASIYDVIANFGGCITGYYTFSFFKNKIG